MTDALSQINQQMLIAELTDSFNRHCVAAFQSISADLPAIFERIVIHDADRMVKIGSVVSIEMLRPSLLYRAVLSRVGSVHAPGRWGEVLDDLPAPAVIAPKWMADVGPGLHGYGATPEEAMRDFDRKWAGQ